MRALRTLPASPQQHPLRLRKDLTFHQSGDVDGMREDFFLDEQIIHFLQRLSVHRLNRHQ